MFARMEKLWERYEGVFVALLVALALPLIHETHNGALIYFSYGILAGLLGLFVGLNKRSTAKLKAQIKKYAALETSARQRIDNQELGIEHLTVVSNELRLDRAALLATLATLFPSGYRWENPTGTLRGLEAGAQRRQYVFIDLPEDEDGPRQLRFLAHAKDEVIIGILPEYEGETLTVDERDSQRLLRNFLTQEAVALVKESNDASVATA